MIRRIICWVRGHRVNKTHPQQVGGECQFCGCLVNDAGKVLLLPGWQRTNWLR